LANVVSGKKTPPKIIVYYFLVPYGWLGSGELGLSLIFLLFCWKSTPANPQTPKSAQSYSTGAMGQNHPSVGGA